MDSDAWRRGRETGYFPMFNCSSSKIGCIKLCQLRLCWMRNDAAFDIVDNICFTSFLFIQKQYAALVWFPRPLTDDDLQKLSSLENMVRCFSLWYPVCWCQAIFCFRYFFCATSSKLVVVMPHVLSEAFKISKSNCLKFSRNNMLELRMVVLPMVSSLPISLFSWSTLVCYNSLVIHHAWGVTCLINSVAWSIGHSTKNPNQGTSQAKSIGAQAYYTLVWEITNAYAVFLCFLNWLVRRHYIVQLILGEDLIVQFIVYVFVLLGIYFNFPSETHWMIVLPGWWLREFLVVPSIFCCISVPRY